MTIDYGTPQAYPLILERASTVANHPKPSAKNEQGEYANFASALQRVLSVSHSDMQPFLPPCQCYFRPSLRDLEFASIRAKAKWLQSARKRNGFNLREASSLQSA
jgi:hypothetical protein